jgi:pleiotropic regulator 1
MPSERASRSRKNKDADNADVVMEGAVPEVAAESVPEDSNLTHNSTALELKTILQRSGKRTRELFAQDENDIYTGLGDDQAR